MVTVPARDGGTVEITRCGALVDIHIRDREGRTVATVTRRASETALLLSGRNPADQSPGSPVALT